MRSMIRSTAEAQGRDTLVQGRDTVYRWKRNPHIAEAMVDQSIYIQGITDSGRVVTFTAREAMKYGFCDGMAESVEEVLKKEQVENYTIRSYHPTVTDRIIGFLINPVIQGLLIMVIVGGIYFELQTPGIGFPLAAKSRSSFRSPSCLSSVAAPGIPPGNNSRSASKKSQFSKFISQSNDTS